jgi:ankyrin repeat protein
MKKYLWIFLLQCTIGYLQAQGFEPIRSSYFAACYSNNFEDIKYHVETRKIDIDTVLLEGRTGLHLAILANRLDITRYFVEKGANINKGDNSGYTPLHLAVAKLNLEMVKLLVEKGADINNQNTAQGYSPLHLAASDDRAASILEYLIAKGGNVNAKAMDKNSAMDLAKKYKAEKNIQILKEATKKKK